MQLIKKQRYDYFLIWGHGLEYQDEILNIIKSYHKIDILKVHSYKPKNIKNLVKAIYSYDYAPFHHLKAKTKYLLNTPKKVIFIFIKTNYISEIMSGKGAFEHIECPYIVTIKNIIRDKFNPKINGKRSEDHVIHASDNESQTDYILKYLGFTNGIKLFSNNSTAIIKIPYHIKLHKELVSIENTPHYAGLVENRNVYSNYLDKFFGGLLSDYYSVKKFIQLSKNFKYLEKPYQNSYILTRKEKNKYIILDGVHRAAILRKQGKENITMAVIK